jgi:hypothetical protein
VRGRAEAGIVKRLEVGAAIAVIVVAASAFGGFAANATVALVHATKANASTMPSLRPIAIASTGCSKAAALQVVERLRFGQDVAGGRAHPVDQVLCGPFFGSGSRGMVVSVALPTGCRASIQWGVFRFAAGGWRLVLTRRNGAFLSAVGSDIKERQGATTPTDPFCSPSAWKSRIWHWNGTRFTASPWKVTYLKTVHLDNFLSPDRKVWCRITKDATENDAWCGTETPSRLATVKPSGAVTVCNGTSPGDCLQNWDDHATVLRYGQGSELYGYRCVSQKNGITCTVIAGAGQGKGFLINAAGVTKVG